MQDFKVNVNLPKEEVHKIAKQIIREIIDKEIGASIKTSIDEFDIKGIIGGKMNRQDGSLQKHILAEVRKCVQESGVREIMREEARKAVIERVGDQPITGGIHIHLSERDVETSWDDY
jgi:NH3-dependent NAD+ synthetase